MNLFRAIACALAAATFTCAMGQTPSQSAQDAADFKELQSYSLTMDVVTRTFQTLFEMKQAIAADPALQEQEKKNAESDEQQKSLAQMAAMITSSPKLTAIIAAHGFTPHGLVLAEMSVVQTSMAMMAENAGAKESDLASKASVNPANLKLLREHQAEVETLSKKYPLPND